MKQSFTHSPLLLSWKRNSLDSTMTTELFNRHVMSPWLGKVSLVVCLSISFVFFHCKITFHFQTPGYWCVSKNNSQWQKEALDQNQVTAKISFRRTVREWLEEHITKREWDMMCPEEWAKIQTFQFRKSTSVFWFENSRLSVLWSPP